MHAQRYPVITLALGMFVCMVIAVVVSVQASNRATRQSIERERAASAAAKRESCKSILIISNAYRSQRDEMSPPGQEIADAWEYLASQC